MHDSSTCPICHGLPVDGRMSDEEFYAFLDACRDELEIKQADFQKRIAGTRQWSYETAGAALTIGEMSFETTLIGTYSSEYQTWLWAWANEDFPEVARTASRQIQGLYAVTGFRVFLNEGIEACTTDAQDFSALAVHQLDAIAIFRCPSEAAGGPVLYLAVHERCH